jgi:hypothetical protein
MNKNSWHYKLATAGKDPWELEWFEEECDNFCKYARSVFRGLFRYFAAFVAIAGLSCIIIYALGDLIAWLFWMVVNWAWVDPALGASVILGLCAIVLALLVLAGISQGWKYTVSKIAYAAHKTAVNVSKRESGFLKLLYTKYKEKICFGVKYK